MTRAFAIRKRTEEELLAANRDTSSSQTAKASSALSPFSSATTLSKSACAAVASARFSLSASGFPAQSRSGFTKIG